MPKVLGWFKTPPVLDWEEEEVSFLYDSEPGPKYYSFPMTGLVPYNEVDPADLINPPAPLWITYLDPKKSLGKEDSKGQQSYLIELPKTFEEYLNALSYSDRKEMRYVLRKNEDITLIENKKEDVDLLWDEYISKARERSIKEGETPFSNEAVSLIRELYRSPLVHTLSIMQGEILYGVNISFRRDSTVYDSICIRTRTSEVKSRSLGTYAILRNIECAIRDGFQLYDMLMDDWGYKTKFGAKPIRLKHYIRCNRQFAERYNIPLNEISELIQD